MMVGRFKQAHWLINGMHQLKGVLFWIAPINHSYTFITMLCVHFFYVHMFFICIVQQERGEFERGNQRVPLLWAGEQTNDPGSNPNSKRAT